MKKPVKIILLIIAGFIFIALMVSLVWGKTIRMASANKLFAAKDQTSKVQAQKIYEDLAVDEPNSPYVLHNLGLSQSQLGKFDQAQSHLQKALKALETVKLDANRIKTILHRFQYHSGNANFKLAAQNSPSQAGQSGQSVQSGQSGQDQAVNLYQAALDNYRKAIEANPEDLDAKYNYELTKLRIQQEQSQQNQPQDQQKDQKDQKDQNQKDQNQKDQQQQGDQQNQKNQSQQQQGDQSQSGAQSESGDAQSKPGEMSKAEAEALLKMAERGEQYQGQLIFGADSPTGKDW